MLLSHVPGNFVSGNKRKWDVSRLTDFLKWLVSSTFHDFVSESEVVWGKKSPTEINTASHVKFSYFVQQIKVKGNFSGKSCSLSDVIELFPCALSMLVQIFIIQNSKDLKKTSFSK